MGDSFIDIAKEEHFLPHEWRMVTELKELNTKICALDSFIETNPVFNDLFKAEQNLMLLQCSAMLQYAVILEMRISQTKSFADNYSQYE